MCTSTPETYPRCGAQMVLAICRDSQPSLSSLTLAQQSPPLWPQGPVSWKTVFPQTGGWGGGDDTHAQFTTGLARSYETLVPR